MGIVRSKISKTFTNTFRGETRMLKEISKDKPTQAPRHPSTEEAFKTLIKENPALRDVDKLKDTNFLNMLHEFKVDSFDPKVKDPMSSLPDFASTYGSRKPLPGTLSGEQILELFAKRYSNAEHWTPENIAKSYRINEKVAEDLIKYYSSFSVIKAGKTPGPLDRIDLI